MMLVWKAWKGVGGGGKGCVLWIWDCRGEEERLRLGGCADKATQWVMEQVDLGRYDGQWRESQVVYISCQDEVVIGGLVSYC